MKNNEFTVCLSHDVDRVHKSHQYLTHTLKGILKKDFNRSIYHIKSFFKENPYWNFEKIMEIEDNLGVKSTFFFLDESIKFNPLKPSNWKLSLGRYSFHDEKVRDIIKKLDSGGWEIGLHGSYNSYNKLGLLKKEKQKLESVVGHEIVGVRQHYLNLNEETWRIQSEAGFKYDSSHGFTREIGFKENKYTPFTPLKQYPDFKVIPLTIMDCALMNKKNIKKEYTKIIDTAEKNQATLVLNWHNHTFNEEEFPGWGKTYVSIVEECIERGARITTCMGVVQDS